MELVDQCHRANVGVILDWVPAHFPKDAHGLAFFDGTALYEHADPRLGEHPDWGTLVFNYGRHEVRNFLLANALYWIEEFHLDGLRVDAVASMLYLDYSRRDGEWVTNRFGGRENLEAIEFIKETNAVIYQHHPAVMLVAEESTSWPAVSRPTYLGGLGFGFKWNMGWMNDTLLYFSKDPIHRSFHHNTLTFSMLYEYSENFIMPLSHDEVVHQKGSLLSKMPGNEWEKFANLRLMLAYLYTHPGKKLLFMGTELAPDSEWDHNRSLDWHLQSDPLRQGLQRFFEDLGRLYRQQSALWEWDHIPQGFFWIDCQDYQQSVVSYVRQAKGQHLVCVLNLTPLTRTG
ncbi:MAG TPA: 1,4-alpha-glucan branching enzyme, partial [Candidatus Acidoferrum sp.]|nr:1,4-alpha-glucan branching enzyme [Candidatus Acidoferrum sp.]